MIEINKETKRKYHAQKHQSSLRGIHWGFTLLSWIEVWEKSGHWDKRGNHWNDYVMCRISDYGPYAPWNVYINTQQHNFESINSNKLNTQILTNDEWHLMKNIFNFVEKKSFSISENLIKEIPIKQKKKTAMTNAERQKVYRERKKKKLLKMKEI
jgi:hypothetical protein